MTEQIGVADFTADQLRHFVDGAVAGTWRYEGGRVVLDPFERLGARARREVRDEAERLAAFHA